VAHNKTKLFWIGCPMVLLFPLIKYLFTPNKFAFRSSTLKKVEENRKLQNEKLVKKTILVLTVSKPKQIIIHLLDFYTLIITV